MGKSFKNALEDNPAMGYLTKNAKTYGKEEPEPTAPSSKTKRTITPKGENRTAHFQMLMTPSLKEAGREAARAHGISLNELLNQLLEIYLDEQEG